MRAYCPFCAIREARQGMTAAGTSGRFPVPDRNRTAFDPERLSVYDGIGDLSACRLDNPAERLP